MEEPQQQIPIPDKTQPLQPEFPTERNISKEKQPTVIERKDEATRNQEEQRIQELQSEGRALAQIPTSTIHTKDNFVRIDDRETLSTKLKQARVGSEAEQVKEYSQKELVEKITREGQDPYDYLISKVREGVRVIGVGEFHGNKESRRVTVNLINSIASASDMPPISTLALEIPQNVQPMIEAYMQTGDLQALKRKFLLATITGFDGEGMLAIFKAAYEAKQKGRLQKVVCIDDPEGPGHSMEHIRIRDERMHQRTVELANESPDTVTIVHMGMLHIRRSQVKEPRIESNATVSEGKAALKANIITPYEKLGDVFDSNRYISVGQDFLPYLPAKASDGKRFPQTLVPVREDARLARNLTAYFEGGIKIKKEPYGEVDAVIFAPVRNPIARFMAQTPIGGLLGFRSQL